MLIQNLLTRTDKNLVERNDKLLTLPNWHCTDLLNICYEQLEIPSFWSISEHSNSKCSSTMVKVFIQKQLEIPSFWSISEHSNSKFSSTMVKEFIQEQLEIPSFWSIPEHANSKVSSTMMKSIHSEAIIMDDHFRRFKFKIRPW